MVCFLTINLKRAHLDTLTQILHAPRILAFCYADRHFNFTYAIMSFPTKNLIYIVWVMCWSGFLTINMKRAHLDTTRIFTCPENLEY